MNDQNTLGQNSAVRAFRALALTTALAGGLAACSVPPASHPPGEPWDPYEDENRATHQFNKEFDRAVFRPVSRGYSNFMPDDIENAISRFSANLSIPGAIVNNILQGNMRGATEDTYRFLVNTTFGLGGFFDPATELDFPAATEADFGETLHVWGVPQGAYVELPFLGPSTERDTVGLVVDLFTNPLDYWIQDPESYYATGAGVSSGLTRRGRFSDSVDAVLYESADSYAQLRSLYLQNRAFELGGTGNDAYVDPYEEFSGDAYDDPYDE